MRGPLQELSGEKKYIGSSKRIREKEISKIAIFRRAEDLKQHGVSEI